MVLAIDQSAASHILTAFLMPLSIVAAELWIPKNVDHEAHLCAFTYFPHAVAAIDSTPIRVEGPVRMAWMPLASWTHTHHIPSFNWHFAVASNGICMAILALLAAGGHDKRGSNDTDAYLRFLCIGSPDHLGVCDRSL
jgi:hypothetical protein